MGSVAHVRELSSGSEAFKTIVFHVRLLKQSSPQLVIDFFIINYGEQSENSVLLSTGSEQLNVKSLHLF